MSIGQYRQKHTSKQQQQQQGHFGFVTTENGELQQIYNLTTPPGVQRSLCLEEVTDDSSSTRVELLNGVDHQTRDMLERCMPTCGKAARARGNPVHEKKRQPKKYENTTSNLLKRNTLRRNPGLTMRFLTPLI